MIRLSTLAILVGCGATAEPQPLPGTGKGTTETLTLPDLTGLDMAAAVTTGIEVALSVTTEVPWSSQVGLLDLSSSTCPDLYLGIPDGDIDDLEVDMGGASWWDFCETGDLVYSGWSWWDSDALIDTDLFTEIETTTASRYMVADATIADDDGARWELDGIAEETLFRSEGPGFSVWTWSSLIEGTVTGTVPFTGTATPSGWRTDLYKYATAGDVDSLELRGNVYLFDQRLSGRFDSIDMDLILQGPNGAAPDACDLEPLGWIGLRDEDAVWYDVVFLPKDGDGMTGAPYPNDPLSNCDGCGTLYVRGVDVGEVCVDLSFVFSGLLNPPEADSFVLPPRGL